MVFSYDETTDPGVWIEDYILHIHMARGDDLHAIKYLPLKLKGPARHWLKSLLENTIGSWLVLHLASQLSSPAQKRVMRLVSAAIVLGFSWPRCLASHSSRTLCLKAAKASASGQSTIWFFLVRNLFQNLRADSPGC